MAKELRDIIKIRFTLEQRDCEDNFICKENKSEMLIRSGENQWNCLSFTSCGKKYSLQLSLSDNKYVLELGLIDPAGFVHSAYRFWQGDISGSYKPSDDFNCVEGVVSLISQASVI